MRKRSRRLPGLPYLSERRHGILIADPAGNPTVAATLPPAVVVTVMASVFEVGDIFITTNTANPGARFGGTWALYGTGRVLVGFDAGQSEFDTIGETGGAKTHVLTVPETPCACP